MPSAYNAELEFHPECSNIDRYNADDQGLIKNFMQAFMSPRRAIPEGYRGYVKRLNASRGNADPSLMTDEQVFEIDQYLARSWFENQPMQDALAGITSYMSKPSWESKYYSLVGDTFSGAWPEFTSGGPTAFRNLRAFKLGVEPKHAAAIGAAIRFDLSWTLKAEAGGGGVYDPENWHNIIANRNFGVMWDERLCLGTLGEHTSGDLGITGVYNVASSQTVDVGITEDGNLEAAGDVDAMFVQMLGKMRTIKEPGANVLITTSGVASELFLHDSSYTDRTEFQRIKAKYFDSGLVQKWIVDDNIVNATVTDTTQAACMLRVSDHVLRRRVAYPYQKRPLMNKEFSEDVSYAFLTADALYFINASGLVKGQDGAAGNALTTTVAGFVANGTFMTGEAHAGNPATPPMTPTFY